MGNSKSSSQILTTVTNDIVTNVLQEQTTNCTSTGGGGNSIIAKGHSRVTDNTQRYDLKIRLSCLATSDAQSDVANKIANQLVQRLKQSDQLFPPIGNSKQEADMTTNIKNHVATTLKDKTTTNLIARSNVANKIVASDGSVVSNNKQIALVKQIATLTTNLTNSVQSGVDTDTDYKAQLEKKQVNTISQWIDSFAQFFKFSWETVAICCACVVGCVVIAWAMKPNGSGGGSGLGGDMPVVRGVKVPEVDLATIKQVGDAAGTFSEMMGGSWFF